MSDETPTPDTPPRARRSPRSRAAATQAATADAAPEAVAAEPPQAEPAALIEPTEPAALIEPAEPVPVSSAGAESVVEPQPAASAPALVAGEQPTGEPAAPVHTIYVHAPQPPKGRGNRVVGTLIALASAVLFGVLYAVVLAIIIAAQTGAGTAAFLGSIDFYVPVLFFAAGSVVVVLVVNRAGWWAHVIASLLVGLFVYFGTVGTGLLIGGVVLQTPQGAARLFGEALANPFVIAAALLAREVALWTGAVISARGRRLKARNAEARAAYDEEAARHRAEYERAIAAARARAADVA